MSAGMLPKTQTQSAALPPRWPWLFNKFRNYAHKYAAKHFHAVRVAKSCRPPQSWPGPALMVMNHPSWWDPILGFILSSFWPNRLDYAPIDAKALQQYRVLGKVGLYGIKMDSTAGARGFLQVSRAILAHDHASIWITAQGEFTDVRQRPVQLRSGVGHLASGMTKGVVIPVALEYPFWDERTPEALAAFGDPLPITGNDSDAKEWTQRIERALETTQDRLSHDAQSRDPQRFDSIVQGRVGVGGMYDLGRRMRSWMSGRRFRPEHTLPPFPDQ